MKTKILVRIGIMALFIGLNSCSEELEPIFACASGLGPACCSIDPDSEECTGWVNEKTRVETDSTLAVSKLPVRE